MPIIFPEEKPFELPPAGTHLAACFRIVDLGTQLGSFGPKPQLMISWELPDEQGPDGRPVTISRRYNLSSSTKSTLRSDLENWLGRILTTADFGQFNLSEMLGCSCLIGIKHEVRGDRTYANVTSVMQPPKGTPPRLPLTNAGAAFSLSDRPFAYSDFNALPSWLQDLVKKSPEYGAATNVRQISATPQRLAAVLAPAAPAVDPLDDPIPF